MSNLIKFSEQLSYEIFEDGYELHLNGERWMVQHEPNILFPELSYEENAVKHCEMVQDEIDPVKVLERQKEFKVSQLKENLAEFLKSASITSKCHNPKGAEYSVTLEKQSILDSIIEKTIYAQENDIEFTPLWNAKNEVSEPYTLEELQTLRLEIYNFVSEYVTQQQEMEKDIRKLKTSEEVSKYDIEFI